jgi:hypothetical protein
VCYLCCCACRRLVTAKSVASRPPSLWKSVPHGVQPTRPPKAAVCIRHASSGTCWPAAGSADFTTLFLPCVVMATVSPACFAASGVMLFLCRWPVTARSAASRPPCLWRSVPHGIQPTRLPKGTTACDTFRFTPLFPAMCVVLESFQLPALLCVLVLSFLCMCPPPQKTMLNFLSHAW